MAHLTDMEELIAKVVDSNIADYMHEALSCYMTSAYRGCIILSYIALFDDISMKLSELSKINGKAKEIYKKMKERQDQQDVFETFVVDQLKSNSIISELEANTINLIKERRNKAAHPSGHHPSAEEARFVFAETINKFLCKPSLTTIQLADDILSRLPNSNFFTSSNVNDIASIIAGEIEKLHEETYPYLISKLVEAIEETQGEKSKNAVSFLNGLARLNNEKINKCLATMYIDKKSDNANYSNRILAVVSSNPLLIEFIKAPTLKRLKKIIERRIEDLPPGTPVTRLSHPSTFFRNLFAILSAKKVTEIMLEEIQVYIDVYPFSDFLIESLSICSDLKKHYVQVLVKKAASSQFSTANSFIENIVELEESLEDILNGEDSLRIIIGILKAAKHNAFAAVDMRNDKFKSIRKIKQKAIDFIKSSKKESTNIIKEELSNSISTTQFKQAYF